jgi:hypothetical protein
MPESGTFGSVRGALGNGRPYRDTFSDTLYTHHRIMPYL